MSNSLHPHEMPYVRLPCPSLSPGVCSTSCQSSQWCHLTTSLPVTPFCSYPQSCQASRPFPLSWFFISSSLSITSLEAQLVRILLQCRSLPAMQENQVRFLGWEDPLQNEMAIYSSILSWEIPWTTEPGELWTLGLQELDTSATKPLPV